MTRRRVTAVAAAAVALSAAAAAAQPPATPPTQGTPCVTSVAIGPLATTAECFRRDGLVWTTSGPVDFGGMKMDPGPNARFVVDPFNARVAARGYSMRVVGDFARTAGQVQEIKMIQEGDFDIAFQKRDDADRSTRFIGTAGGEAISLATIAKLPGLSGVTALPEVIGPDGRPLRRMPDYSKVAEKDVATLQESGRIAGGVTGPTVTVPLADLGLPALEPFLFTLPPGVGDFLGLDLKGSVKAIPEAVDGTFGFTVEVESTLKGVVFDRVAGEIRLFVAPNGVAKADRLRFAADQIAIPGAATIKPVELDWDSRLAQWGGKATLFVPALSDTAGFGADWRVKDGVLQRAGITVGVPIPLGEFTINSLSGAVEPEPFALESSANVSFGPATAAPGAPAAPLVDVDGALRANDSTVELSGAWSIGGERLGRTTMGIDDAGVTITGKIESSVVDGLTLDGELNGFAEWSPGFRLNAEGTVDFRYATWSSRGIALASADGLAACANVTMGELRFGIGAGYRWGEDSVRWLDDMCDMGPFRVVRASGAMSSHQAGVATPGAYSTVLRARSAAPLDAVALRVAGGASVPRVAIPALGVSTGAGVTRGSGWLSIDDPDAREVTVIVAATRVAPGRRYVVRTDGGQVVTMSTAAVAAAPGISGSMRKGALSVRVSGAGSLRAATRGEAAPVLVLSEVGPGVRREIGRFPLATRTVRFTPGRGPAGARRVIARVEQGGMPRVQVVVARFRADASRLATPRVRVSRARSSATVRWGGVAGATGYLVTTSANGVTRNLQVPPGRRSVRVVNVVPGTRVAAAVRALSTYPATGPAGTASREARSIS